MTSARGRLDVRTFYGETADLTEQLATLDAHAKAHPDDADAVLVQGYMAYFTRDFRRAEQVFSGLATRSPSDELVLTLRRLSLLELDRARGLSEF